MSGITWYSYYQLSSKKNVMKVLCATDFSDVSVNAIEYVFNMLKKAGGELEILHCVEIRRRADMFVSIRDFLKEKAEEDMAILENAFVGKDENVKVKSTVKVAESKTYIPRYASHHNFDLIVTGTTGLTSLKNLIIGSVTYYISNHTEIPLLIIPDNYSFKEIETVVIGLGKEEIKNIKMLDHVYNFLKPSDPKIYLAQVIKKDKHVISVDTRLEEYLKELTYEYTTIEKKKSLITSIDSYCKEVNSDLLCLIHQKKNWLNNLIYKSTTKEELFSISSPVLIIPD